MAIISLATVTKSFRIVAKVTNQTGGCCYLEKRHTGLAGCFVTGEYSMTDMMAEHMARNACRYTASRTPIPVRLGNLSY
jgi:hypothetical protein